jgi:hypothetical protein
MQITRRALAPLALVLALAACSEDQIVAPGTVLGSWGGQGAQLVGETDGASLNLGCGALRSPDPIRLDIEGQMSLAFVSAGASPVVAIGTMDGDVMQLQVTSSMSGAPSTTYTLHRGQQAVYGSVACALTGS